MPSPGHGTSTPELPADPDPDMDCVCVDSSMLLLIREKLLGAVVAETDFLSSVHGEYLVTFI